MIANPPDGQEAFILTKISVYIFALGVIGLAIPVFSGSKHFKIFSFSYSSHLLPEKSSCQVQSFCWRSFRKEDERVHWSGCSMVTFFLLQFVFFFSFLNFQCSKKGFWLYFSTKGTGSRYSSTGQVSPLEAASTL